jgi:predicted dehydrogenase
VTPVRVAMIGLGHITQNAHLPPLAKLVEDGKVVLRAFCDVNEETVAVQAKEWGAQSVYTDHRAMFDGEDLDAVYVCLPPTLHTDAELIAAEKGIAVFVEKPQSLNMAQAVEFSEAIDQAGIVSQVGFMSRYYPSAECVVEMLEERTPRHAQVQLFYSGRHIRYWTSRMALCGGSFVENTIHMVDLLRFFLGDIESVSAFYFERAEGEGPEPIDMPHVYNVNYRFKSGAVANATASRVLTHVSHSRREVTVVADDALFEWSTQKVTLNGEDVAVWDERPNPFAAQAQAFVDAVRKGDRTLMRSPYGEALNSLAAVLGANASAERNGEPILLDDFIAERATWVPGEDI